MLSEHSSLPGCSSNDDTDDESVHLLRWQVLVDAVRFKRQSASATVNAAAAAASATEGVTVCSACQQPGSTRGSFCQSQ